ncbi:MAG: glycosyl hydrolase [Pirellulaceae bacterium]
MRSPATNPAFRSTCRGTESALRAAIGVSLLVCLPGLAAAEPPAANSVRNESAQQVLETLRRLSDDPRQIIIGQNIGDAVNPQHGAKNVLHQLARVTPPGRGIGLIGVDYGWGEMRMDAIRAANRQLIPFWQAGGLVTIDASLANPFARVGDPLVTRGVDINQLLDESSDAHKLFVRDLDKIAAGLAQLRDANVVVLWRPLHEMNGGWFWWQSTNAMDDAPQAADNYRRLWRWHHDYFTHTKQLDNLLWVYSAAAQSNEYVWPTDHFYPGDAYVDVVGIDVYVDQFREADLNARGGYDRLIKLGKPFAVTEIGSWKRDGWFDNAACLAGVLEHCPQSAYMMFWHSWPVAGGWKRVSIPDNRNAAAMLNHPAMTPLGQFPHPALATE